MNFSYCMTDTTEKQPKCGYKNETQTYLMWLLGVPLWNEKQRVVAKLASHYPHSPGFL